MSDPWKKLLATGLAAACVLLPQAGHSQALAWVAEESMTQQVNSYHAREFQAALLKNAAVSQPQNSKVSSARTPEELIMAVYKLNTQEDFFPPNKTKSFLIQYFDEDLANLFIRANECRKRAASCTLDFNPISGGNGGGSERGFSDFAFKRLRSTPEEVLIQASYTWFPGVLYKKTRDKMTYRLRLTTHGWRISDIVNPNGYSIKSHLSQPFSR